MNNRRNLKENLTISNKQRFSIRKFSIGVASVMLGTTLYFMGGVGTSIVHADSVQGQSVQTSNLDTNSAQASSDTSSAEQTSSQNQTSSAQNSQKAVSNASSNTESTDSKTQTSDQVDNATTDKNEASQADNASATNIKTRDNKKVVSDANRAKSTANDTQTKPAQQTAKSDAANSNTLVVQRTKKLTVNAKLLADSKAQTDTKTDSNYSVTDNYPKDLMTYLPSNFNNTQEYAFEWLQNENNNIILTTNRTGDGVVYVYQNGKKVGTYLAPNSSDPLPLYGTAVDSWGNYHKIEIGEVYNDNFAGIVQSNGLSIIYSSHAKDVDDTGSSYSTVSFFVPRKIKQTVTYYDSKGNVIDSLTHTQYGLTGQSYTTGLPSGPKYVRRGEYLDNITNNGSGLMSEFYDTYSCTKDYHDGVSVTFRENDSRPTGTGTMDYVIYDGDVAVQWGYLAYGQSTNYTNDSGRYTIVNPYVPQTTNIVYQYKKLGNVVNIVPVPDPEGKTKTKTTTTQYKNDQNDPTTIEPIKVPSIPGYTTMVNGETVSDKTKPFWPADLSKNTYITYTPHQQKAKVLFIDDTAKTTLDTHNLTGVTNGHESYNPSEEIEKFTKEHYVLVPSDYPANGFTYDNDDSKDQVFEIHLKHGTHAISDKKSITETITYKMSDGSTAPDKVEKQVEFSRDGYNDEVTKQDHWNKWQPGETQTFDVVPTPEVKGYTPDIKSVEAKTVTAGDNDITVTVTYNPGQQKAKVLFIDDTAKKTLDTHNLTGVTNGHESYSPSTEINQFVNKHYVLVSSDYPEKGFTYDNDDSQDQVFEIHLKHSTHAISDKKSITETITYKMSDDSKAPDKVEKQVEFSRVGKHDDVTNTDAWNAWQPNTQSFSKVPTPEVKGYTPDIKSVEAKTVTAGDKDITVTVTYNPDQQKAKVLFIDDTAKTTLDTHNLTGVTNGHESYSPSKEINQFVDKHYVLVSSDYPEKGFTYDNDDSQDQVFEVHLVHTYEPVETSQTITETVHYIDANGKPVAPDHVAKVVIKVTGTRDKVTDSIIWNTPSTGHFDEVISPEVPNMTPDKKLIPGRDVQYGDSDITESVVYTPDNSTSKTPEKPDKPSKEVSKIPEKPNKSSKEVSKAPEKSIDSRTVDNHVSAKSTAKRELPQTGATTNTGIWTGLVSMIASLGLLGASKKRKKN